MGIKKGKDGYYRTSVSFKGKVYSVSAKTESEALRKAGALKAKLQAGIRQQSKMVTVSEFANQWLSVYRDTSTDNDKRYEQIVKRIIVPAIGCRAMDSVTEQDLQRLLNDNAHYSKSQLSKIRLTLKQIFKKARKNRIIIDDPAEDLVLPKCSSGTHREITDDERRLILETADEHQAGLYIKIMLYCGLRPNEVDALQWRFVDLKNNRIMVRQAVKHGTNVIGTPKSKAGIRDIPIPAQLLEELRASYNTDNDAYVCTNCNGDHHTAASRNRMWNSFKRCMDIANGAVVYRNRIIESTVADDLTLYCLRHTYCTDLQRAGVPLNVAKTLMGHEDISVTANIYTHVSDKDTSDAVKNLETYLDDLEEKPLNNVIQFPFGRAAN